jgi:acyl-CoA synthetase (NDP forming)
MDPSPLLAPRSIAVVGANDRPGTYADLVLRNLGGSGFEGTVWGVNPNRESAHGRECVPTVSDLPEPVDAVVIAIPAPAVPEVIEQAGTRGCGGAIVISAGFAEVESGRELQSRLRDAALAHDLPVCGPNGNGIFALHSRAPMWGDSVPPLDAGRVAMVSQSGNLAVNALGSRRGVRFHTVVSTGNQAVMGACEWVLALAEQPGVGSIAMFLEADGDGARLAEALASCVEAGIGVAVLKVGSSPAGVRAAAAHTAAVAGDQRVFRALMEEAGAAWAADPHDLLELAKALAEPRARRSNSGGLAVLGCSGGDSGLAADEAQRVGAPLPELAPSTRESLSELLPPAATVGNPLDYTAMIWGEVETLREMIRLVGADPGIDQLLVLYDHPAGLSGPGAESWTAVRAGIVAGAAESEAPVLVSSTLPDLLDDAAAGELAAQGVPALAGLRTAFACAQSLRRASAGNPARLREIAAAAAAAPRGVGEWLDEADTKELLRRAGAAVPEGTTVTSEEEAVAAWRALGGPVALKLSAPGLLHKSESGAVELALATEEAVRAAHRKIASPRGGRILVERMAEPGLELLVGVRANGVVPALAIGLGGVYAEALDDVAIVPLPAGPGRVSEAIRSLRGAALLTGERGARPLDVEAAARLASRAAWLALEHDLTLLELNPVVIQERGAVAVDALARRSAAPSPRPRRSPGPARPR